MKFRYQKFPYSGPDKTKQWVSRPFILVRFHGLDSQQTPSIYALLDSGADGVLLPSDIAVGIGIKDFHSGVREYNFGIGQQTVETYLFDLGLEIIGDGRVLPVRIGFSEKIAFPIIGRIAFSYFKTVAFHQKQAEVELIP